ncbi:MULTISPECIES: LLM class flavin-dependent oxidoreductase [unclassified Parafrankia]|uniref:LLM class flavin-dependent oxidoreductase n=1 Tax=Parafrankia TaxID=2994362 RepID=UPI000DA56F41|nr:MULTISPECIES: LLM class flavin-dependent oxidoreductase [unclassified Parafrankia]TCJ33077.1 LLM class flavin-dependent oxidoreductase [Parafrankia sp. BMG5.11]CAI7974959.1 Luciferase family protein [Frankia sp. Hr75.2]SQD96617.1 Luciferase family protein [Parafrankia sp. Ea1.12]
MVSGDPTAPAASTSTVPAPTAPARGLPEAWLFLPQLRMDFPRLLDRVRAAEAAGFDGVAFMDHLAPPGLPAGDSFDAMTTATAALAATSRLRVGHLVLCASFRHPAVLAKEAVSLDHLSGGRFELGLGWGSTPAELERFGLPVEDNPTRAARLAEYLEVLGALFGGEEVTHEGRFFTLRGALQHPVPVNGRIPLLLGGAGRKLTMPMVARHADWWNCPTYGLRDLAELRPLAGGARLSTQHPVGFAASGAELDDVTAVARKRFGNWGGLVVGTPDTLAEHFGELAALGVERFYLQFTDFATPETIEAFARDVLPAVRQVATTARG